MAESALCIDLPHHASLSDACAEEQGLQVERTTCKDAEAASAMTRCSALALYRSLQ